MPGVEGQWGFYPNLRLKIKHTLRACGTFYAKSHRYKKYATTTIMSQITNAKSNSAACTLWRRQGGGATGTRAPFRLCPGSWLAAGRQRQQQPVDEVESDAADAGDWRMRAASDVTADTPTPKHAACCNGCRVSV